MKCQACGYDVEVEKERMGKQEQQHPISTFKEIDGNFTITDRLYDTIYKVSIYACPQCGTLRLSDYDM